MSGTSQMGLWKCTRKDGIFRLGGDRRTEGSGHRLEDSSFSSKENPHRYCLSRCCSCDHSSGMTIFAGTALCYHKGTLQWSRAACKAPSYSFLTKTTQFFHLFLWNFPILMSESYLKAEYPFAESRGETFIAKVAFSFPRNHKNLLKRFCCWQNTTLSQADKTPTLQDK